MDAYWKACENFRAVLDSVTTFSREDPNARYDFQKETFLALLELTYEASKLPMTETDNNEILKSRKDTKEFFSKLHDLSDFLADYSEKERHELANDLAEVYEDICEGLAHRDAGEDRKELEWSQWWQFWNHWSDHAGKALKALSYKLQG